MEMAAGMCAMIGYAGGAPTTTGQVYPDPMGGYNGAAAVMTALMHRQETGEGQYIELSQVEAAMQFIGEELLYAIAAKEDPELHGNRVRWAAPHDAYPAARQRRVGDDCRRQRCGMAQALRDHGPGRARHRSALCDVRGALAESGPAARADLAMDAAALDKHEIADRLQAAGIRAAPVNTPKDVTESPYLAARKAFVTLTHPDAGTHGYMTLPFRLSLTPGRAAPCLALPRRRHAQGPARTRRPLAARSR